MIEKIREILGSFDFPTRIIFQNRNEFLTIRIELIIGEQIICNEIVIPDEHWFSYANDRFDYLLKNAKAELEKTIDEMIGG